MGSVDLLPSLPPKTNKNNLNYMKHLNYLLLGAAGLLLASCSNEEKVLQNNDNVKDYNLQVTVTLPDNFGSRAAVNAFGTGEVAKKLNIAVYDYTTGALVQQGLETFPEGSLSMTVAFNLAKGKKYNLAFFAQSAESMNTADTGNPSNGVYDFSASNGAVTVNYNNMNSSNNLADAYDCFWGVLETGVISEISQSVSKTLTRVMAQINWGANDLTSEASIHPDAFGANGQYIVTTLQTKVFTKFNLVNGTCDGEKNVTLSNFSAPYTLEFPYNPYDTDNNDGTAPANPFVYIAMQYVLVPADGYTADLSLSIGNDNNQGDIAFDIAVANVPLQANYQTNIYGALLTNDLQVTVTKYPTFFIPDENVPYEE